MTTPRDNPFFQWAESEDHHELLMTVIMLLQVKKKTVSCTAEYLLGNESAHLYLSECPYTNLMFCFTSTLTQYFAKTI